MSLLRYYLIPELTDQVQRILLDANIHTVEEILLTSNRARLSELLGVSRATNLVTAFERRFFPETKSAFDLFAEAQRSGRAAFSTGCTALDSLLGGGVFQGELFEIAGQMAAGKTQLCFGLSLRAAASAHPNDDAAFRAQIKPIVLFLDCCGSFSLKRLQSIYLASADLMQSSSLEQILARIHLVPISTPQALFSAVFELYQGLCTRSNCSDSFWSDLKLIVIDGIATKLHPTLSVKNPIGHANMLEIASYLKFIAHRRHLAVMTTNWMSSILAGARESGGGSAASMTGGGGGGEFFQATKSGGGAGHLKPGLGEAWLFVPHTRLLLTHVAPSDSDDQNYYHYVPNISSSSMTKEGVVVSAEVSQSSRVSTNRVIRLYLNQAGFGSVPGMK